MEIAAVINSLRQYSDDSETPPSPDQPLEAYGGKTPAQLKNIIRTMLTSRRIEMEEMLMMRKGHNKFFIGAGGKELADAVLADGLRMTDPFLGYYRNKAFEIHRGSTVTEKFYETLGDVRAANKGQLQSHCGYPERSIIPQISVTGGHAIEASAIAEAIKHPTPVSEQSWHPGGAWPKDSVVVACMGEGSTSEPEFNRAIFNAVFFKSPAIFAIYNCGWAISVNSSEQFINGDPTLAYQMYQDHGLKIIHTDGTEIKQFIPAVEEAVSYARDKGLPVFMDIKVTRERAHSGSDDQSHYMDPEERERHIEHDPILKTCRRLVEDGVMSHDELAALWEEINTEVSTAGQKAVKEFQIKDEALVQNLVYRYDFNDAMSTWKSHREVYSGDREARYKEWHEKGFFTTPELPENLGITTMRQAINYTLFDLMEVSGDTLLFGQDVADFSGPVLEKPELQTGLKGKGGVFLVTRNIQKAFGNDRCFNTPLDEASILGRAAGHCQYGRRTMPEIQFIDYMSPAYMQLKDRICTINQRSGGKFRLPMVIRCTYGGYKHGAGAFWHSEANLGTWLNIPGLLIVVPSNAYDAAGLLKTAWATDDVVLFCESVSLYNRRDWEGIPVSTELPDIDELIPFGEAKVYNRHASDVGIITYGGTVHMARRAAQMLEEKGVGVRVVDLRTVRPLDEDCIRQTAKECGKVLIVTEDRLPGGAAATISTVLTKDENLFNLEAPIKLITAMDSRVAYGLDGDDVCLPSLQKIMTVVEELHEKY